MESWYVDDPDVPPPSMPAGYVVPAGAGVHRPERPLWPGWPWPKPGPFFNAAGGLFGSGDKSSVGAFLAAALVTLVMMGAGALYVVLVVLDFVAKVLVAGTRVAIAQGRRVHRRVARRRDETQRAQLRAEHDAWHDWNRRHRLTRADLYRESHPHVLEVADRLIWARDAVRSTRAWREEWISNEWHPVIERQVWSMLQRLHDSLLRRDDLAEARARPALADVVAASSAEIQALDAEATALAGHLTGLVTQAHQLDQDLAARDQAERDAHRDAELRARLTGTSVRATEVERELRMARDQVLNSAAEADLSILSAQLDALSRTLRPAPEYRARP